jgi:hypothetical protein
MAASASDTAFLTHVKSMTYRGAREEWANVYHLSQVPPNTSDWASLSAIVWESEVEFLPADVQLERMFGHAPGNPPVLVWEYDAPPPGEGGYTGAWAPTSGESPTSGDVAGWIRWTTTQKTSLGKPIYLRNYFHGLYHGADKDAVAPAQVTPMNVFAAAFASGFVVNGITYRRAGPRGAVAQGHAVGPYLTTRTLKARGRRRKLSTTLIAPGLNVPPGDYTIPPIEIN